LQNQIKTEIELTTEITLSARL